MKIRMILVQVLGTVMMTMIVGKEGPTPWLAGWGAG
jgi:hypothetical protein